MLSASMALPALAQAVMAPAADVEQGQIGTKLTPGEDAPASVSDCGICLSAIEAPSVVLCRFGEGGFEGSHTFCEPCIRPWLQLNNICPVCRADVPVVTRRHLGLPDAAIASEPVQEPWPIIIFDSEPSRNSAGLAVYTRGLCCSLLPATVLWIVLGAACGPDKVVPFWPVWLGTAGAIIACIAASSRRMA